MRKLATAACALLAAGLAVAPSHAGHASGALDDPGFAAVRSSHGAVRATAGSGCRTSAEERGAPGLCVDYHYPLPRSRRLTVGRGERLAILTGPPAATIRVTLRDGRSRPLRTLAARPTAGDRRHFEVRLPNASVPPTLGISMTYRTDRASGDQDYEAALAEAPAVRPHAGDPATAFRITAAPRTRLRIHAPRNCDGLRARTDAEGVARLRPAGGWCPGRYRVRVEGAETLAFRIRCTSAQAEAERHRGR